MLSIEELQGQLKNKNLAAVARQTGIHQNTLYRITKGRAKPSYETTVTLSGYLTKNLKGKE